MGGLVNAIFGRPKASKPDPETVAAQKRSINQAAENAQQASAQKANEAIRAKRQGRKQLLFAGTGGLGVSSKLSGRG